MTEELQIELIECPICHQKHKAFLLNKEKRIGSMKCQITLKNFIINGNDIIEYIQTE